MKPLNLLEDKRRQLRDIEQRQSTVMSDALDSDERFLERVEHAEDRIRQSEQEIERLARLIERERSLIARMYENREGGSNLVSTLKAQAEDLKAQCMALEILNVVEV